MANKQRILVCLVSAQALPNYLFIKEMFIPGDRILLITSKGIMEQNAINLKNALRWASAPIDNYTFSKKGIEDDFEAMNGELSALFSKEKHYLANITGGTKLMSLSLYKQMEKIPGSDIYYMPYPQMQFLHIAHIQQNIEVTTTLGVADYLAMYGMTLKPSSRGCSETYETAQNFFEKYTTKEKKDDFYSALEKLRERRNKKSTKIEDCPEILPALSFFEYKQGKDVISKIETEYLTGGWFEEWTYYTLKEYLKLPEDGILINPHVSILNRENELDVVFIHNNNLYIVECKSGIEGKNMLNSILDKANSIKSLTKSLSAQSVLFAVVEDNEDWRKTADAVGIKYIDKEQLADSKHRFSFIK